MIPDPKPRSAKWHALAACMLAGILLAACGGGDEPAAPEAAARAPGSPMVALSAAPAAVPVTVQLQPLAEDVDVPNPDRGFYRWAALDVDTLTTPAAIAVFEADAQAAYDSGYRVLYARIRLDAWRQTAQLPVSVLDAIRAGFGAARRSGVKLLPRFVYNDGPLPGESLGLDAPLPVVLAHLAQLKKQKVLEANADAMAFLQGGFVGAWGEWHSSSSGLTEPAAMAKIRDALLAALPADQFLQLRNPQHMIAFYPQVPVPGGRNPLRIGIHNDCFLASDTDVGSYSSDPALQAQQREYVAALGKVAPFGAETCWPPEPAQARMTCADIEAEGRRYALTYLNDMFYQPFMDAWRAEGCYDRVKASMGYRLRLKEATYPAGTARGATFALDFTVDNAGWARVYKAHGVRLVLRGRGTGYVASGAIMKGADPRAWVPGEGTPPVFSQSLALKVPKAAPLGVYDVCVGLPDARAPQDARYAIRPANADDVLLGQGWDAALGAFCVGAVTVN